MKGFDIPLPPGLVTSPRSPDSGRSDDSSLRSSESSSLDNSANSNTASSLKSSTSSGVHTNASETSSLNHSPSVNTPVSSLKGSRSSSSTDLSEISRSRNSTGTIHLSANNTARKFSTTLALGRSLQTTGDSFQVLRNHPLTARIPAVNLGNLFKTILQPLSADVENNSPFRTYPITNKTLGMHPMDYSMKTTKKPSNIITPDVPIEQYYRVQNLVCNDINSDYTTGVQFLPRNLLEQPSTVFVYSPDAACVVNRMSNKQLRTNGSIVSDKYVVVTASIHKMYSMKEKAETSPNKMVTSNDNTPNEDFKDPGKSL